MKSKGKLDKVVTVNSKVVGRRSCSLSELYERRVTAKSLEIISNTSHILASR